MLAEFWAMLDGQQVCLGDVNHGFRLNVPVCINLSPGKAAVFLHHSTKSRLHTFVKVFTPGYGGAVVVHIVL